MPAHTIDAAPTAGGSTVPPHRPADQRPTVLIVDDRPINREFLVSLLKYSGYRTVEANSPAELPQLGHIDLIITDVHMPKMNGLDFLSQLRADSATQGVPVILYTATYKSPDIESQAKALGAFAVLTKPTAPEAILEQVRAALSVNGQKSIASSSELQLERSEFPSAIGSSSDLGYRSAALIEIMLDLSAERDSEQLVRNFCLGAKELMNAREVSVHIVAPVETPGHLCFSTDFGPASSESFSLPSCDCDLLELAKRPRGRSLTQSRGGEAKIAPAPLPTAPSVLCAPISTATTILGCVRLVDKLDGTEFNAQDERFLTTLATKLAIVYENIKLYKEVERFAVRLARESEVRERTQEELDYTRQEQARLKDEFLSHVSHELRSPVMVLHQFLEILLEGVAGEVNEQQRGYLDIALRNANQLNVMISDLLEATRIQTGKLRVDLKSMPLADVLNEATKSATLAARQKHIEISLDVLSAVPLVIADRSRVRQIVTNFLENAIKFTPENGSIEVRAAVDGEDSRFVRISVTDTGCGMKPEDADKVFDRLYQVPNADANARKGLGLGLCICKQLAVLQGGQIAVQSKPGAGSTFSFTLPVFSLADLITPLLGGGAIPESMVLIAIEVADDHNRFETYLNAALRETIERCVQPDLDVLLPDSYSSPTGRLFIIVARADERGAKVLARRLEKQLKLNGHVADLPDPPLVQLSPVALSVGREGLSLAEQQRAVVSQIQERLKAIIKDRS